jgi:hypothetical protein
MIFGFLLFIAVISIVACGASSFVAGSAGDKGFVFLGLFFGIVAIIAAFLAGSFK